MAGVVVAGKDRLLVGDRIRVAVLLLDRSALTVADIQQSHEEVFGRPLAGLSDLLSKMVREGFLWREEADPEIHGRNGQAAARAIYRLQPRSYRLARHLVQVGFRVANDLGAA